MKPDRWRLVREFFRGVSEWLNLFILTPRFLLLLEILAVACLAMAAALSIARIVQTIIDIRKQ